VFPARGLGTLEGSAQLGTRNSSQAVRGNAPTSLTLRGARRIWPPGPMLNVPGSRARLQSPLAPPDPRSGARTVAGAELQRSGWDASRDPAIPPPPAMSGDGPYWSRRGRDRSALTGRAALGTNDASLKRPHEPAQLLDAPDASLVEVSSIRAKVLTPREKPRNKRSSAGHRKLAAVHPPECGSPPRRRRR